MTDSEASYRLLFESNPNPMWVSDWKTLAFLAVNDAAVRHYGYSRKEFLAMTIEDIRPPEDVPVLRKHLKKVLPGLHEAGVWRHLKKDGTIIEVEVTAHSLRFQGRQARLTMLRDVTESQRAEGALRRSEQKYRTIVETAQEGIWVIDKEDKTTYVNRRMAQMLGYSTAQMQGRSVYAFLDGEVRRQVKRNLQQRRRGIAHQHELRLRRKDGSELWTLIASNPLMDEDGRYTGALAVVSDITEDRRAQEDLRRQTTLLELLQMVAAASNQAQTAGEAIEACLQGVCAYTGWPVGHAYLVPEGGASELIPTRFWHPRSRGRFDHFRAVTEKTFLKKGEGLPGRVWLRGQSVWMDELGRNPVFVRSEAARSSGLRSGFGFPVLVKDQVAAVLEFFTDAPARTDQRLLVVMSNLGTQLGRAIERERDGSERKRLEREILAAAVREQNRIGQDLHDSLGQNLTGIALLSKALREKLDGRGAPEEADAQRIAALANSAVREAKDLARGLLPVELQAGGIVGALRALSAHAAENLGVACELRCRKPVVMKDAVAAVHLYRMAQEAVHNAAKHANAKRVRIDLAESREAIHLTVADDGVGIAPAAKRRRGMGLEIMQYRARMLGASWEVRRAGGAGGTVMACSLPKASLQAEA